MMKLRIEEVNNQFTEKSKNLRILVHFSIIAFIVFIFFSEFGFTSDIDKKILNLFKGSTDLKALVKEVKKSNQYKSVNFQIDDKDNFGSISINLNYKLKIKKLPLYPVIAKNKATMASFESLKDSNFLLLPPVVKEEYKKLYNKGIDLTNRLNSGKISSAYFEKETDKNMKYRYIPKLLEKDFFLYNLNGSRKIKLKGIKFETIIEAGKFQIDLKFENNDKKALFVFDHTIDKERVKIKKLKPLSKSKSFNFLPESSTIVPISKNAYYIGSIYNTYKAYDVVMDTKKKRIISFNYYYGVCYGNEQMNMVENYLLEYKGKKYLLRFNERRKYCEVLYFENNKYETFIHSDITAPEI